MVIPREARRVTYSSDIRNRKRVSLNQHQRAIIIGSILGDAGLYSNWSRTNYRLKVQQCLKQSVYVEWKYEALAPLVLTPPQQYVRTRSVWFRTISHPELTRLHAVFYRDGKKIIPENIAEYLANPVTMAVWFMDDGNIKSGNGKVRGYNLNTQSFSREENIRLRDAIEAVHGIGSSIEHNHHYYRLGIYHRQSREKFVSLVREFVIPSLQYKIG